MVPETCRDVLIFVVVGVTRLMLKSWNMKVAVTLWERLSLFPMMTSV